MDVLTLSDLTWHAYLTVGVLVAAFVTLVFSRLPADFVFLAGLAVLVVAGVLDSQTALSGFSSSGLITVGVLYVVVAGLQDTGGLSWITTHVLGRPGGPHRAQTRLMAPVTMLSAFLNNTPVVAMFIPVVTEWGRKIGVQPSRLLIPLSYASILGGLCTLIGTSTNLVVNSLMQERFQTSGMSMFEITKIGVICAVAGVIYLLIFMIKLLPARPTLDEVFDDPREYTLELRVKEKSAVIGKTIEESGLRHLPGAYLAELMRGDEIMSAVSPDEVLEHGDRLVFVGNIDSMRTLYNQQALEPAPDQLFKLDSPRHQRILVEAVVSDTCPLVGRSIRGGRFRNRYNAVVIAVARNGQRVGGKIGDIVLQPGDTLLIEAHAGFIPRQRDSRDFYLISRVENSSPRRFEKAPLAFGVLIAMVLSVTMGWLTLLQGALAAAGLMLATGCCSVAQARRSIEWNVLLVIAAAIGIGRALDHTGVAPVVAHYMIGIVHEHPWAVLAMVYVMTNLFTEVITNNGAAVLVFPIAMSAVESLGVNPMPFIICVMIAASASFATPIGYQTNLMVYGPGGYRFSDYMRIGIPLNLLIGLITVALSPLIWGFGN